MVVEGNLEEVKLIGQKTAVLTSAYCAQCSPILYQHFSIYW